MCEEGLGTRLTSGSKYMHVHATRKPTLVVYVLIHIAYCTHSQWSTKLVITSPSVSLYISLIAVVEISFRGFPLRPPASILWPLWRASGLSIVVLHTINPSAPPYTVRRIWGQYCLLAIWWDHTCSISGYNTIHYTHYMQWWIWGWFVWSAWVTLVFICASRKSEQQLA